MAVKSNIPQPAIDRSPKAKAGERKPQAQGVGESKRHGGGGQTLDMSKYTVNGEPLPLECWDTFPVSLTDQGKAEMAAERKALPLSYGRRDNTGYDEVGSEDKKLDKFRDDLAGHNVEMQRVADPMEAMMRRHTPQGHRGLFMSSKKCADSGMIRGILEYRPVLIDDPETGSKKRVEVGGMFLASVPEHLAAEADRHYASINKSKQVAVVEKVRESADQIMSEGRLEDMARRRRLLDDISGEVMDDPESADQELLAHESA